jgi:hypothetical protein
MQNKLETHQSEHYFTSVVMKVQNHKHDIDHCFKNGSRNIFYTDGELRRHKLTYVLTSTPVKLAGTMKVRLRRCSQLHRF